MNVGFIGLGHMGGPMSRNVLAAGYDLVVHDVHREAAAELEAAGAAWAATPRETGAGREVVITMLPTPPIVEQVLLGENGLLAGLAPGTATPAARCSPSSSTKTSPVPLSACPPRPWTVTPFRKR